MSTPEQPETPASYLGENGRLIMVLNHTSTSYEDIVRGAIGSIYLHLPGKFDDVFTEEKPELTKEKIASTIREGDIILSGGGDGSDNICVETLLRYPGLSEEQRRTPIISWYGGNANMGPVELIPKVEGKVPSFMSVLNQGLIVESRPLQVRSSSLEELDEVEEPIADMDILAMYFYGQGATGSGAHELHEVRGDPRRDTKSGRNRVDTKAALYGLKKSRKHPFSLTETVTPETGEPEVTAHSGVYAATIVNGHRMAKVLRFPSQLTEEQYFKQLLADKRRLSMAIEMVKNVFGRGSGMLVDGSTTVTMDYQTDNGARLWSQADGDRRLLASKGRVTVSQYPRACRFVTTQGLI